jgi:hypothetical protein
MKRSWIVAILGLLLCLTAAGFLAAYRGDEIGALLLRHPLVTYDGTSFTPKDLTIDLGETVTFTNRSGEAFWPASNLHPSHLIWSDFDPKKPIAPGDSWSFTFTKPGIWGYHDHVKPTIVGTIRVRDQNGADPVLDCTSPGNKQQCWENDIQTALDTKGVDGAFTVFKNFYETDPQFASGCHVFSHLIGEKSYDQFVNNETFHLSPQMQLCGYGFFHGFMETLLIKSGDITLARDFCARVGKELTGEIPAAMNACYHGIGHGAVDGGDPRSWGDPVALITPAISLCDRVGDNDFHKYLCGTGVFNGISVASANGEWGLKPSKDTVFKLCEAMTSPLYKKACYEQINTLVYFLAGSDKREALAIVDTVTEPEYYDSALFGVTSVFSHYDMTDDEFAEITGMCNALTAEKRTACFNGFVSALVEYGPLGKEYEVALHYCDIADMHTADKENCYEKVALNTSFIFAPQQMVGVCDAIAQRVSLTKVPTCSSSR